MCLKGGLKILNEDRQKKWYIIQKMQVEKKRGRKAAVDTRRWLVLTYSVMMDVRGRGGC